MDDAPYENTLTIEELRREVRRGWNLERDLRTALKGLPEVPPRNVLLFLSGGARFPEDWERGNELQRKLPYGTIPSKTECEMGAGLWVLIREAIAAAKVDELAETRIPDSL